MSRRRLFPAAAALGAAAVVLSGCAVAGTDLRPGVGYEYDGESVSINEVNTTAQSVCDLISGSDSFGEPGAIRSLGEIKADVASTLAAAAVIEDILAESDVELPAEVENAVGAQLQAASDFDEGVAEEIPDYIRASVLIQYAFETQQVTQEDLIGRIENGVDFNPVYGISFVEGLPVEGGTETSEAVSDGALLAQVQDPGYVQSLPAAQRCGGNASE